MSEKIIFYLKDAGFPERLINIPVLSADITEKLSNAWKIITTTDKRILLLSGTESPVKEYFAMSIVKMFVQDDKHMMPEITASQILRRLGSGIPIPNLVAYFLLNTDMGISGNGISIIKEFIINQVQKNKSVIVGCASISNLEKIYGIDFVDYLSHVAVEVDLSMARAEIPVI